MAADPPRPLGRTASPVVGAGLAAKAVGLSLVAAMEPTWLVEADRRWADDLAGGGTFVDLVTSLGAEAVAFPATIVGVALVWRVCRPLAVAWLGTVTAAYLCIPIVKELVGRSLPPAVEASALPAFPSGHTMLAAVWLGFVPLALVAASADRRAVAGAAVAAGVASCSVASSRVQLGEHWPSDVLGGLLFGGLLLWVALVLVRRPRLPVACTGCALHAPEDRAP